MTELPRSVDIGEVENVGWQLIEPSQTVEDPRAVRETVLEIADHLGDVVVHGDYPQVMKIALIAGEENSHSYYKTPIETPLHTDMAWWPGKLPGYPKEPPKYIVMGCERPADNGGVSIHANAIHTFQVLSNAEQQLLMDTKFKIAAAPHHAPSEDMVIFDSGKQGILRPAIAFGRGAESPLIRLNPNQEFFELNSNQPAPALSAIRKWNQANRTVAEARLMTPGQIIVVDNHRAVHKRTAFNDPKRVLWRAYSNP